MTRPGPVAPLLTRRRLLELGVLACITVATLFTTGYSFPGYDHDFLIPLAKYLAGVPYTQDIYLHQIAISYQTYLMPFLAQWLRWDPEMNTLPTLFFALHVLGRFAFFLAGFLIARKFSDDPRVHWLTVLLLAVPKPTISSAYFSDHFKPYDIGLPLVWFAFFLFLKNRTVLAFFLSALTFNLHPQWGLLSLATMGLVLLPRWLRNPRAIPPHLLALGAGAPMAIWTLTSGLVRQGADPAVKDIVRYASSWHYFPLDQGTVFLGGLLVFLVPFFIAALRAHREDDSRKAAFSLALGAVVLTSVGLFATHGIYQPTINRAALYQSILFIYPLLAPFLVEHLLRRGESGWQGRIASALPLAAYLLGNTPLLFASLPVLLLPNRVGLCLGLLAWGGLAGAAAGPDLVVGVLGLSGVTAAALRVEILQKAAVAIPYALPIAALWLAYWAPRYRRAVVAALPAAVAVAVFAGPGFGSYLDMEDRLGGTGGVEAWVEVQGWFRQNAPDSLVAYPPDLWGFRIGSHSSSFAGREDGAFAFMNDSLALRWWERFQAIGYGRGERHIHERGPYRNLGDEEFLALGPRFGVTHVVVEVPRTVNLTPAFENSHFRVYALPTRGEA